MADFGHYSDSTDTIKCENNVSERPDLTAAVILAFRDGLGVEDIGVLGIAPTAYARAVLKRLHAMGMTEKLFRQPKAKTPNNKWNPIGGLAAALVEDAARKIAATKEGGET